jgi:hypothetical protein
MTDNWPLSEVVPRVNEEGVSENGTSRQALRVKSRSIVVFVSIACVAVAELIMQGSFQDVLANIGYLGLIISSVSLLAQKTQSSTVALDQSSAASNQVWRWTIAGLGLAGMVLIQSWFRPGTAIAGGDIAPPVGTAWIGRIFSTFGWDGNTLGGPVSNQKRLPWAALEWITHLLGGSAALSQRIWLSLLVGAVMMSAGMLARALGFSPLSSVVVSLAYFFNPMTISEVGVNDVFLTAMFVIPLLAAAVLSYGNNRLRLWQVCAVFSVAAPFVGYVYSNPPLVGLVVATTSFSVALAWTKFGRAAAKKSTKGLIVAGSCLVLTSSYWLMPAIHQLNTVATSNLAPTSTWAFTQTRATLTNGLWLNNTWGWKFSLYYPYAPDYGRFPFNLIPVLIPVIAFSGLARRKSSSDRGNERLKGLLAFSALIIVLLSTGTNPPGRWLFDPLYNLPHGWLLREPGRFLIVVALGYALLAGLLVDQSRTFRANAAVQLERYPLATKERWSKPRLTAAVVVLVAIAGSFPLWTGLIVPGPRQGFPSTRVVIPSSWTSLGDYLNSSSSPRGPLLVFPPDDFYAMPYTWYYGNDGFIVDLLDRHVIVPSEQSYYAPSKNLLHDVQLESAALLEHHWIEAGKILNAIGTPMILVRGDVVSNFAGRSIVSPTALRAALKINPETLQLKTFGPLSLFELRAEYKRPWNNFVTVNRSSPNLGDLNLLPQRTALVTSSPLPGRTSLFELPPLQRWAIGDGVISTHLSLPKGRHYHMTSFFQGQMTRSRLSIDQNPGSQNLTAHIQILAGNSVISNGDFSRGAWGPVGNCFALRSVHAPNFLRAETVKGIAPGRLPALQLSASVDSACESTNLTWHSGPLVLSLWARNISGNAPRICVWQQPINSCASIPAFPNEAKTWQPYSATIDPSPGAERISLFVYADAAGEGIPSIDQYANIRVRSFSWIAGLTVLGTPVNETKAERIVTLPTGYSSESSGPPGTRHLIVNGLTNGYLLPSKALSNS